MHQSPKMSNLRQDVTRWALVIVVKRRPVCLPWALQPPGEIEVFDAR